MKVLRCRSLAAVAVEAGEEAVGPKEWVQQNLAVEEEVAEAEAVEEVQQKECLEVQWYRLHVLCQAFRQVMSLLPYPHH